MDAENPTSLRRLFVRVAATLLALVGLYVLGFGPSVYLAVRHPRKCARLVELYDPLRAAVRGTPLEKPLFAYQKWWFKRAVKRVARWSDPTGRD